jgi:hypothetical protein
MRQVTRSQVRTAIVKHGLNARGAFNSTVVPNKMKHNRKLLYIPAAQTRTKRNAKPMRMLQVGLENRRGEAKLSINYVVLLKKTDVDSGKAATLQADMGKMSSSDDTPTSSDGSSSSTSTGVSFMETLKATVAEVVENLPADVKARVSAAVDTTAMKAEVISQPEPRSLEQVNQQVAVLQLVEEIINSGQAE